jgi:hypothetical protein
LSRLSEKLRITFSRLVLEWGISSRYQVGLPLSFKIVKNGREKRYSRIINGQSFDLSESGLGILSEVISSDGLHAHFSNDMSANTSIEIELELPEGKITIIGETCRYLKLEQSQFSYLLGIKITKMSAEDKLIYERYLSKVKKGDHQRTPRY